MARLSSPIEKIEDHYTVVVIGSGYGGGIAASRLARAGQRVCLLERGKELVSEDYPNNPVDGARQMQFDLPNKRIGPPTGLYDFRVNKDINVVLGCGLGGTSLINANISLPADDRTFDDHCWPAELRGQPDELAPYYELARQMLKPDPYPNDYPALSKLDALQKSAAGLGQLENFYRPPLTVNFQEFEHGINHVGVFQQPCKLCGDCVSGCKHAAKNTTLMNYLPDAHNHGAQIFTEVSVRHVERKVSGWVVHYRIVGAGHGTSNAPIHTVGADIVVLAAGTLGSTEILLRSAKHGLALSQALGHNFTGNGDMMSFAYNNDQVINGVGYGNRTAEAMENEVGPVGPCIAGIIDMRGEAELDDGQVIEEGCIPGALAMALPMAFATAAAAIGRGNGRGLADCIAGKKREMQSIMCGPYRGAIHNTQTYLVMSHDGSAGRMYLDPATDRLRIEWEGVGSQPGFGRIEKLLEAATKATGGTHVRNPISTSLFKDHVVTVHPLGGCPMADDAKHGVVNHKSQVFVGPDGTEVHDGLYVCDGAVVPRSLGVNPLLTISALAERSIAILVRERGWELSYALPSAPRHSPATATSD